MKAFLVPLTVFLVVLVVLSWPDPTVGSYGPAGVGSAGSGVTR